MTTTDVQSKPKSKKKFWIIFSVLAILTLACFGACTASLASNDKPSISNIQPNNTSTATVDAPVQQAVTVSGNGAALMPIGATLNGRFKVDFGVGTGCLIVDFLKADGSDAAGFADGINDCNFDKDLTGSKMVDFNDASMIEVDNTRADWTLTFTPLS